ncbi:hypothetical protein GALL_32340 [mine drainage metagenome]|uniref:Uncharacterized protein n=1 Tax=mine drainage metagenome TaxID=410659 RepID=A0A1J5THG6_9ZZZZ
MKRKVGLVMLGAMLHGNAHAAEPNATADPSLNKESVTRTVPSTDRKSKSVRGKKAKPRTNASSDNADPKANVKQDAVTETPPGSIQQSVQLRGVRG